MGTPVRATYYGGARDRWSKIVDEYRVVLGQLFIDRRVVLKP
jgi:hypothetical protein